MKIFSLHQRCIHRLVLLGMTGGARADEIEVL